MADAPCHKPFVGDMRRILQYAVALMLLIISVSAFAPVRMDSRPHMVHNRPTELYMGGKTAKFGIFSPAVIVAKTIIGETKFNKIRGKAISLHSQVITEFCQNYGAYNLRLKLIKKAKKNGDILGFLS